MSNLLKGRYIAPAVNTGKPKSRVIDSNGLIARRIEELAHEMQEGPIDPDGFSAGIAAEQVELLTDADPSAGDEEDAGIQNVIKNRHPAEVQAEADALLKDARSQADQILAEAERQAAEIRRRAQEEGREEGLERGRSEGYQEGLRESEALRAEYQEKEAQLETEYQKKVDELEPMFIDTLTDIYEHVFHVSFSGSKEVIFHLIQDAVRKVEGNTDFIIHVSQEDYGFVSMQKKELLVGVSNADSAEIVEDMTLKPNECFIETGTGIFDCSLETQLEGLRRELRLLSYSRDNS